MIVILMGVVGAGKTTIGRMLAEELHWQFADADDYHPAVNIEKIRCGIPLTDQDREPWLLGLQEAITDWIAANRNVVLACSALKESYRRELAVGPKVKFVFLQGSGTLISERLHSRHGHFAGEQILASQLADLEEPRDALRVSISSTPDTIVREIRNGLALE